MVIGAKTWGKSMPERDSKKKLTRKQAGGKADRPAAPSTLLLRPIKK